MIISVGDLSFASRQTSLPLVSESVATSTLTATQYATVCVVPFWVMFTSKMPIAKSEAGGFSSRSIDDIDHA